MSKLFVHQIIFLAGLLSSVGSYAQVPIKHIPRTHSGGINKVCFTSDGKYALSSGADMRTTLWDAGTFAKVKTYIGFSKTGKNITSSFTDQLFVCENSSGKLMLVNSQTLAPAKVIGEVPVNTQRCEFNKADGLMYLLHGINTFNVYDKNGQVVNRFTIGEEAIKTFSISNDGKTLFTLTQKGRLSSTSLLTQKLIVGFTITDTSRSVITSVGSSGVAIITGDNAWIYPNPDFKKKTAIELIEKQPKAISANSQLLAVANQQGKVTLHTLNDGKITQSYLGNEKPITDLALSTDKLIAGTADGSLVFWELPQKTITPVTAPVATAKTEKDNNLMRGVKINEQASEATLTIGRYHALIIGIDGYSGAWRPLQNAVNDAKAIENVLKSKYKFDQIRTLYNEQASRINIIKELEKLVSTVSPNDNVLIFYSGHGEFNKALNKGYWVPVDAADNSTSYYISNSDLQTYVSGINSKHTLLVSDACFSGDIFRGQDGKVEFENTEKYFAKVNSLTSRKAITSGGIEPVMDGGKDNHSVFTYYLLKALEQNTAKYMDANYLFEKVKVPVVNNSEQIPNFSAIKNTGDEGGLFLFVLKQ